MFAEIGVFSLILALLFSILLSVIPTLGMICQRENWIASSSFYTIGQWVFVALAYLCLTLCFLNNDFSVVYVLSNSSINLPWFYKLCAVWGGHEGSMLLWVLILSFWMLGITFFSRPLTHSIRAKILVVLGVLSVGFILFLLATSNPFIRQFVLVKTIGRDLNPLLQDPGFLFHPPMLYMGYVGFSVAFAFAIAALWEKKVESNWAKWTRPWTLAAWSFLTAGITLGSLWAYRELGWGGWWFWDPVENASFMPWLTGTALLHSLAVTEKRKQFKAWTILLAITTFSLSLIGTFLVRSGVLTSVHAFAVDPTRGLYILCFLLIIIGGSLFLFAIRSTNLQQNERRSSIFSRESVLLLNNVFLIVAMLTVLMGTVYPLFIDGLGLGKLSVGTPYFNSVFTPIMLPLLLLMGIGTHFNWQIQPLKKIGFQSLQLALISLSLTWLVFYLFTDTVHWKAFLGLLLAVWIICGTLLLVWKRVKTQGFRHVNQSLWSMVIAHFGVACTVVGIALSSSYSIQDDVKMRPGDKVQLGGYTLSFLNESRLEGPNYHGVQIQVEIQSHNKKKIIYPEKRIYDAGKMSMTEAAIDIHPFRDIYVALGEPLDDNSWSLRVYYKPFIRFIWGGGFLILAGGILGFTNRRYYKETSPLTRHLAEQS